MFRNFKSGQHNAIRLSYKKAQDAKNVTELMAWWRRNYPEAFKGDE